MYSSMVCWCTQVPLCILTGACQRTSFLASGRFWGIWSWKPKSKHRRNVSLSGKSGQTTPPTWSENINLASRELICAQVILKGRHSLRLCMSSHLFSTTWCLGKPRRHLRVTSFELHVGIPLIIGANASASATAKPSPIELFHLVPPEYYLTAMEMENSADRPVSQYVSPSG